jgi:hypothetical protein
MRKELRHHQITCDRCSEEKPTTAGQWAPSNDDIKIALGINSRLGISVHEGGLSGTDRSADLCVSCYVKSLEAYIAEFKRRFAAYLNE